jgi:hypothetical protein
MDLSEQCEYTVEAQVCRELLVLVRTFMH